MQPYLKVTLSDIFSLVALVYSFKSVNSLDILHPVRCLYHCKGRFYRQLLQIVEFCPEGLSFRVLEVLLGHKLITEELCGPFQKGQISDTKCIYHHFQRKCVKDLEGISAFLSLNLFFFLDRKSHWRRRVKFLRVGRILLPPFTWSITSSTLPTLRCSWQEGRHQCSRLARTLTGRSHLNGKSDFWDLKEITDHFSVHTREYRPRENITFLENGTKIYALNPKTFVFVPEKSAGDPEVDIVRTIHIPLVVRRMRLRCIVYRFDRHLFIISSNTVFPPTRLGSLSRVFFFIVTFSEAVLCAGSFLI